MPLPLVTLVDLDAHESAVLRTLLEHFGFEVRMRRIGLPRHFIDTLSERRAPGEHLIVSCHGDEKGIVLPELHPRVAESEQLVDRADPSDIAAHARLGGRHVVATGCGTGSEAFGHAFLACGAVSYLAPDGDPEDAVFFLTHVYQAIGRGRPIEEAFAFAQADSEPGIFRLYTSSL